MGKSDQMMLSQPYTENRARFPGFVSQKYDGVPGGYTESKLISRQGKALKGVQWIHDMIKHVIPTGVQLWGEHYELGKPFKHISGRVRNNAKYAQCNVMFFNLFDMFNPSATFGERQERLKKIVTDIMLYIPEMRGVLHVVQQKYVQDAAELSGLVQQVQEFNSSNPVFEGCMYHYAHGLYTLTRSHDSMKLVQKQLIDLKYIGCRQAINAAGIGLGMAGKLYFKDAAGKEFGVGPGKLTHAERRALFEEALVGGHAGKIAVVQAKRDASYTGLREATFQHWHEDKTEPDEVC